ncbi:MAG: hypothetical protein BRD23_07320 [Halobacteriales archaeon SW_9_67_25]|nr:MAG: hypothetical protein BRD23_07320 [Halobacteriales archaeon SW_9_67_25]
MSGFIDRFEPSEKTLLVVNRTQPEPLVRLLERGLPAVALAPLGHALPAMRWRSCCPPVAHTTRSQTDGTISRGSVRFLILTAITT